jgi:DNA-binding transcriptional LysR family regulator
MDIDNLKAFYISATLGNISHAAERLNMTRSAISKRIVVLEEQLRVKLLDRSGAGVELTEEGMAFLEYAADACEKAEAIRNSLKNMQKSDAGEIKLITTRALGGKWFSRHVSDFIDQFPKQKIKVRCESIKMLDLTRANTGVYAGFLNTKPKDDSFYVVHELGKYHLYPYAHPDYLKRTKSIENLRKLEGHQLIAYQFDEAFPWIGEKQINRLLYHGILAGEARTPVIETDDALSAFYYALQGNGIALLPEYLTLGSKLIKIDIEDINPQDYGTYSLYFLYPHFLKNNFRVKTLKNFITQKLFEDKCISK